ncbi:MAG: hypothetical protein ACJA1B_002544 [Polaribacter sp.]|jgi:hypothetical protein
MRTIKKSLKIKIYLEKKNQNADKKVVLNVFKNQEQEPVGNILNTKQEQQQQQ